MKTTDANDLLIRVKRGEVGGMSVGMRNVVDDHTSSPMENGNYLWTVPQGRPCGDLQHRLPRV